MSDLDFDESSAGLSDVLIVRRIQQTVRAIRRRTGLERYILAQTKQSELLSLQTTAVEFLISFHLPLGIVRLHLVILHQLMSITCLLLVSTDMRLLGVKGECTEHEKQTCE